MQEIYFYKEENFKDDVEKFIKEFPEYLRSFCEDGDNVDIRYTYSPETFYQPESYDEEITLSCSEPFVFVIEDCTNIEDRYELDLEKFMDSLPLNLDIPWEYEVENYPFRNSIITEFPVRLKYWIEDDKLYMEMKDYYKNRG